MADRVQKVTDVLLSLKPACFKYGKSDKFQEQVFEKISKDDYPIQKMGFDSLTVETDNWVVKTTHDRLILRVNKDYFPTFLRKCGTPVEFSGNLPVSTYHFVKIENDKFVCRKDIMRVATQGEHCEYETFTYPSGQSASYTFSHEETVVVDEKGLIDLAISYLDGVDVQFARGSNELTRDNIQRTFAILNDLNEDTWDIKVVLKVRQLLGWDVTINTCAVHSPCIIRRCFGDIIDLLGECDHTSFSYKDITLSQLEYFDTSVGVRKKYGTESVIDTLKMSDIGNTVHCSNPALSAQKQRMIPDSMESFLEMAKEHNCGYCIHHWIGHMKL